MSRQWPSQHPSVVSAFFQLVRAKLTYGGCEGSVVRARSREGGKVSSGMVKSEETRRRHERRAGSDASIFRRHLEEFLVDLECPYFRVQRRPGNPQPGGGAGWSEDSKIRPWDSRKACSMISFSRAATFSERASLFPAGVSSGDRKSVV